MTWAGMISMPICKQCDHCGEDEEGCIIDDDTFDSRDIDTDTWTVNSGDWRIEDGRLKVSGAGRITMDAEPEGLEDDAVKVFTKIRCTEDGVAWVTVAENAVGDRLGVELTAAADCLTMRLGMLANGGSATYYTPPVACFVLSGQEQVEIHLCWVPGAPITPEADSDFVYAATFVGSPEDDWTAEGNAVGAPDDFGAVGTIPSPAAPIAFSAVFPPLVIPDGSTIDGIAITVRAIKIGEGELDLTSFRITSGDDIDAPQAISNLNFGDYGQGGATDTMNATLTAEDFALGVGVVGGFEGEALRGVEVDSLTVRVWWTTADRGPGRLTAVAIPIAGLPPGGAYAPGAIAMAAV